MWTRSRRLCRQPSRREMSFQEMIEAERYRSRRFWCGLFLAAFAVAMPLGVAIVEGIF